ncbi:MAG: sulfotransferase [Chloroflexota bacterium]
MHRSGTSLLANWLQRCDLHIGDDLVSASVGNTLGHFENVAFLRFHRAVLKENGVKGFAAHLPLKIPPEKYALAREIVAHESVSPQWGWKDPRTCLFLPFWKEILPEARFLCVYRHPAAVADSLRRRISARKEQQGVTSSKTHWRKYRKQYRKYRHHIDGWTLHNQAILDMAHAHPDDTLIVKTEDLPLQSHLLINHINQHWGFSLKPVDFNEVYQPKMLRNEVALREKLISALVSPSSLMVYTQLERERAKTLQQINGACSAENGG